MNKVPSSLASIDKSIAKVKTYLAALEARDVELAQSCLSPDAVVIGPGGRPAASVQGIVENSAHRYRRIGKHIERFDAMASDDGGVIVYCSGTLHGEWLDGREFSGIRFIDRFELQANVILRQEVWNDSAERRLSELTSS